MFSSKPSPPTLRLLTVNKTLDLMQESVRRMDEYICCEMCKLDAEPSVVSTPLTTPGTRGSLRSGLEADVESQGSSHPATPVVRVGTIRSKPSTPIAKSLKNQQKDAIKMGNVSKSASACPVNPHVLTKSANDMLNARQYILKTLKTDFHPLLMKHVIMRAVSEHMVQLLRLVLTDTVQVLDFRALEYWLHRPCVPQHLQSMTFARQPSSSLLDIISSDISLSDLTPSESSSTAWTLSADDICPPTSEIKNCYNFSHSLFVSPNEFDWFSRDKMGVILNTSEAVELFSIIKMSECSQTLEQLCINAKRVDYFVSPEDTLSMSTVNETLAELKFLNKLVLRGICDDEMLKTIGQNMNQLKHLDVSGSQFVTDTGIQFLFFKGQSTHSALYLISAWIVKNMDKMNPCTHTLVYLDYSYTCVTAMGRKMVQLLPGSYLYKRLMSAEGQNDAYGHHVFLRDAPCMHDLIPARVGSPQCKIFEKHLTQQVGARGAKDFLTIVHHHPWRNCILNVYTLKNTETLVNMPSAFGKLPNNVNVRSRHCYGIITPNQSEKRIQGLVYWSSGILTHFYTIYPVNINVLGMLHHLKLYRGILSELWRLHSSLLPELVQLDIFAEPPTFINIIQSCASLRRIRIRIRRSILTDVHLIKAVENSMCRRTLEDIWIGPAKFMDSNENDDKSVRGVDSNSTTKGNASNVSSFNSFAQKSASKERVNSAGNPASQQNTTPDLVQLSMHCVAVLIDACPKLKRLGDLSTWTEIEEIELYSYSEELKAKYRNIVIIWGNMHLPHYGKRKDRTKATKYKKY